MYLKIINTFYSHSADKVKVFTVATEPTDGYRRYLRSANVYDIEVSYKKMI